MATDTVVLGGSGRNTQHLCLTFVRCEIRTNNTELLREVSETLYVKELGNYKTHHKGEVFEVEK